MKIAAPLRINRRTPLGAPALLLTAAFLGMLAANPALAQQAAEASTHTVVLAESKTLFDKIMLAGPAFMLILFLASVFMVWLVIDGVMRTAKSKLVPPAVVDAIRRHLIDGDYESAAGVALGSDTVFGNVSAAAFTKVGLGKDATDDAIFEESERARGIFNARISYLSVIGVITPMVGLTGTVFGMIHAFDTLGSSGVGDPSKLSAAIGEVLVCTGGGLVVAIPAFAFYYVMRNRISAGFRHVQTQINAIFHHLPYEHLQGLRLEADAFVPSPPRVQAVAETGPAS